MAEAISQATAASLIAYISSSRDIGTANIPIPVKIPTPTPDDGDPGDVLNVEHELRMLAGEDLDGDWWKCRDPPKELAWADDFTPDELREEIQRFPEQVNQCVNQNSTITSEDTAPIIVHRTSERLRLSSDQIGRETGASGSGRNPGGYQQSHSLTTIDTSISYPRPQELSTPERCSSRASFVSSSQFSHAASTKSQRSSRQESFTASTRGASLYFSLLPKNNRAATSTLASPRVESIKQFFRSRIGKSECSSCLEDHKNKRLVGLACQHKYCYQCLQTLVKNAMQDESVFPPRCCLQEIPRKHIATVLSKKDRQAFNEKAMEYMIPWGERLYCPVPTCSAWIQQKTARFEITCEKCKTEVCRICKGTAHPPGTDCPEDLALQAVLREGESQGWQRCYRCRAMVELTMGCTHMTCKCKAEFCYVCGAPWKICGCSGEEEHIRRAQQVEREAAERFEAYQAAEHARLQAEENARREAAARAEEERRRALERWQRKMEAEKAKAREDERSRSLRAKYDTLARNLNSIHAEQRRRMRERHRGERKALEEQSLSMEEERNHRFSSVKAKLARKYDEDIAMLEQRFLQERKDLVRRHEEEEDDYWFELRSHLCGKPNREAREKNLKAKLKSSHQDAIGAIARNEEGEMKTLEEAHRKQVSQLDSRMQEQRVAEQEDGARRAREAAKSHFADEKWFDLIAAERNSRLFARQLSEEQEQRKERKRILSLYLDTGELAETE